MNPTFNLSKEEFLSYAPHNKDLLPELKDFALNMNFKIKKSVPVNSGRRNNRYPDNRNSHANTHANTHTNTHTNYHPPNSHNPITNVNWLSKNNQSDTDKLHSNLRGLLNKFTKLTCDSIIKEITELNLESSVSLEHLVELIFEKAVSEYKFTDIYGDLCNKLCEHYEDTNNDTNKDTDTESFKMLLLRRCQRIFKQYFSPEVDPDQDQDQDSTVTVLKYKDNVVGFVSLIGELYNRSLLTDVVINDCIQTMLSNRTEDTVEYLCALLNSLNNQFNESDPNNNSELYDKLTDLKDSPDTSIKDRFRLMDLLELKSNWKQ